MFLWDVALEIREVLGSWWIFKDADEQGGEQRWQEVMDVPGLLTELTRGKEGCKRWKQGWLV